MIRVGKFLVDKLLLGNDEYAVSVDHMAARMMSCSTYVVGKKRIRTCMEIT